MTTLFYIADPSDPTYATVLLDFLGFTVPSGTGFTVADGTLDLGVVPATQEWMHAGPTDGGVLAQSFAPETMMAFSVMSRNVTYDALLADALALAAALAPGGVIVWQPDGATVARYIDFYPCEIPALFRGQPRAMLKVINLLRDPEGLPLNIPRHPLMRGPDVEIATSVAISNAAGGGDIIVTNPGNWQSEARLTIAFNGSGRGAQTRVGRRSEGNLAEFQTLYSFTPTGPAGLTNRWKRIWHQVISPTDETALLGTFKVFAAMKLLDKDDYEVQLRWGMVDQDPVGGTGDVIPLETTGYAAFADFADVELGYVTFDESGAELVIEAWARSDGGADIDWGVVTLFPADEQLMTLASPGQRFGRFGKLVIEPEEMTFNGTAESDQDGVAVLWDTGDYIETSPEVLPAGVHSYQFSGRVRNVPTGLTENDAQTIAKRTIGELQILTSGGGAVESSELVAKKGRFNTGYGDDGSPRRCVFIADGSTAYKARVIFTDTQRDGREIRVRRVTRWFIPTLASGREMITDARTRGAWISDGSGARWWPLELEGPFLMLPPGQSVLIFRLGDASQQGALQDADAREPLAKAVSSSSAQVTVTVTPRFTH